MVNKQNDTHVCFRQDVFEDRKISTKKHPVSVIMLGVVASNGEKMPPVWFPTGDRLTAVGYRDVLDSKLFMVYNETEHPPTLLKTSHSDWSPICISILKISGPIIL